MMDWLTSHAPVIGLLFFFTFFMVMALWVYRPGKKESYQIHANIPLEENENE